jgi:hypothetical protein
VSEFDFWLHLHLLGWPIWVPATIALAVAAAWAGTQERRHLFPWLSLAIVLTAVLAEDLSSSWHRVYRESRPVWGAGMLSILVVALLPLATILVVRALVMRRAVTLTGRILLLTAAALFVRLVVGAYLYRWIQRGLLG